MGESHLEAARRLGPVVRERAEAAETLRRLPDDVVDALRAPGLFRLCVPAGLGGPEVDPRTLCEVIEEVSCHDGAAGWCVMIASTTSLMAAYLPEPFAAQIYADPDVVTGGTFAPNGRAIAAGDGHVVAGRWQWGSGSDHCDWLCVGCLADPLRGEGGPDFRLMFLPRDEVEVLDTWFTSGLRGTGSNDLRVHDRFVPDGRSVGVLSGRPLAEGALYAFPLYGLLALGVASVMLGIARRAVDEVLALAAAKRPMMSAKTLAHRPIAQVDVARAQGAVRGARAYLFDELDRAWEDAQAGGRIGLERRARLRLACAHAASEAAVAVDLAYRTGGGSSVFAESPLQRCFRDVHTATQHVMVSPQVFETVGRMLLGVEADTTLL